MSPEVIPLEARKTAIDGLWTVTMKQVTDERGTVREFYRESAFREAGLPAVGPWSQLNITETRYGAIRGLHGEDMTKVVAVASGEAFGAYVDARRGSATYGTVVTVALPKGVQVIVPPGVCNGFQTVSPNGTQYLYCFVAEWVPGMAGPAISPLDPSLDIAWPLPVDPKDAGALSAKDAGLPGLADLG